MINNIKQIKPYSGKWIEACRYTDFHGLVSWGNCEIINKGNIKKVNTGFIIYFTNISKKEE